MAPTTWFKVPEMEKTFEHWKLEGNLLECVAIGEDGAKDGTFVCQVVGIDEYKGAKLVQVKVLAASEKTYMDWVRCADEDILTYHLEGADVEGTGSSTCWWAFCGPAVHFPGPQRGRSQPRGAMDHQGVHDGREDQEVPRVQCQGKCQS